MAHQRVYVGLDGEDLARLDGEAQRLGVSRSALVRSIIEDCAEREQEAAWAEGHEAAPLAEARVR